MRVQLEQQKHSSWRREYGVLPSSPAILTRLRPHDLGWRRCDCWRSAMAGLEAAHGQAFLSLSPSRMSKRQVLHTSESKSSAAQTVPQRGQRAKCSVISKLSSPAHAETRLQPDRKSTRLN